MGKRARRQRKLRRKEECLIGKLQNVDLPPVDRFTPFDNTDYQLSEEERSLCAKGLKFVPPTPRIDYSKKQKDFNDFARKLRLAVHFGNPGMVEEEDEVHQDQESGPGVHARGPPTICPRPQQPERNLQFLDNV